MSDAAPALSLLPTLPEMIARARADLRAGVPVGIDGWIVAAAETVSGARLAAMRGLGPLVMAVTDKRAAVLKARAYDGDLARVSVPGDAGPDWIRALADPSDDLSRPLLGPFQTLRAGDGVAARAGVRLAKSAELLPAVVMVRAAAPAGLSMLDGAGVLAGLADLPPQRDAISARVPMAAARAGRVHVFRPEDGGVEHYAVEIGSPSRSAPVLARLHSACFTGDVLGSLKCDCGAQLNAALAAMGADGAGVLLYLNQEGRGIGLANKMRAYALQDRGFDTVEANHRLGFEDDERDFRIGAEILKRMGFAAVRLMTNNPAKLARMAAQGIEVVDRVPLRVGQTVDNAGYLAVKARKSGHLL